MKERQNEKYRHADRQALLFREENERIKTDLTLTRVIDHVHTVDFLAAGLLERNDLLKACTTSTFLLPSREKYH